MKSLSDYTKQLRDLATNLNIHGESVEMIVQMLANTLYISEIENISYTQEASLDRATLENSKIQHCVNEMYSVYRGANPRVMLNFKTDKIFKFNVYDKIISSNNFNVYFLGYFNESSGDFEKSGITVYPDTNIIVLGLMSAKIHEENWTITEENLYYHDIILEDELSSDLYMTDNTNSLSCNITRIFSDHIKNNSFFDLTLPGYGMRVYYPEIYNGLDRSEFINLNLSINVFQRLLLSDISDSELKSIKMTGANLESFANNKNSIFNNYTENYPGVIYINETDRDSINSIHYKANKNRFTGSYLSTTSDLSYLLQEYYPDKIKSVTHTLNTISSTKIEESYASIKSIPGLSSLSSEKVLIKVGDNINITSSNRYDDPDYLPKGTLSFSFKRQDSGSNLDNIFYDIIPSQSIIPVTKSFDGSKISSNISLLSITVCENNSGNTKIITNPKDLKNKVIGYKLPGEPRYVFLTESFNIPLSNIKEIGSIVIFLMDGDNLDGSIDPYTDLNVREIENVEIVYSPEKKSETSTTNTENKTSSSTVTSTTSTTKELTDNNSYLVLDLESDTIFIQVDNKTGNMISSEEKTKAVLYENGIKVDNPEFSIISPTGITCSIDSKSGEISITDISVLYLDILVIVKYSGKTLTKTLRVYKSLKEIPELLERTLDIIGYFSEGSEKISSYSIFEGEKKEIKIDIPSDKYKEIKYKYSGNDLEFFENYPLTFNYTWKTIKNLNPTGGKYTPSLCLYYVPYSSSNLLSELEILRFKENNLSYYITKDLEIKPGNKYIAKFQIDLELYQNSLIDDTVLELLSEYNNIFNLDFGNSNNKTTLYNEICSLITKVSGVKYVNNLEIIYTDLLGNVIEYNEDFKSNLINSYFEISCIITSITS